MRSKEGGMRVGKGEREGGKRRGRVCNVLHRGHRARRNVPLGASES